MTRVKWKRTWNSVSVSMESREQLGSHHIIIFLRLLSKAANAYKKGPKSVNKAGGEDNISFPFLLVTQVYLRCSSVAGE